MKHCIYCGLEKPEAAFSDEHIWPKALGGDFLPRDVWRTNDVCQSCNSLSGVFVDGAFIRSWMGKAELSRDSLEYLAGKGKVAAIPLDFIGEIQDLPVPDGYVAEYWAGPCGASIIHFRPDTDDEQWAAYAGGDPRAKKRNAGRAYMALVSEKRFWVLVALESFREHFDRAERYVVNMEIPANWPFKNPDKTDPLQKEDLKTVEAVIRTSRTGNSIRGRKAIRFDLGNRMLAKLGLAMGYKLMGWGFLETDYAKDLRRGFREANAQKRRAIPVRGSGFLNQNGIGGAGQVLGWPGGWVLMINVAEQNLMLSVISPSGRSMTILVCDEPALVSGLDGLYRNGVIWITVPAAQEAIGPILLPEYLAHQTNMGAHPALTALASKRGDLRTLPRCRDKDDEAESSST
jgi:HNH endonuclease